MYFHTLILCNPIVINSRDNAFIRPARVGPPLGRIAGFRVREAGDKISRDRGVYEERVLGDRADQRGSALRWVHFPLAYREEW